MRSARWGTSFDRHVARCSRRKGRTARRYATDVPAIRASAWTPVSCVMTEPLRMADMILALARNSSAGVSIAIAFNAVEQLPQMPRRIAAAFQLDENEWQGRTSLQLRIEHMYGVE